jgi:hypothetical protein
MRREQVRRAGWLAIALAAAAPLWAQLPLEPLHDRGQDVTPAYEGWFQNTDGTFSIVFGYYNRNQQQDLDIPIGPSNRIDPEGPDRDQPTHFLPGRQWGLFTITVPKDFGKNKVTWTLSSSGKTTAIPASLDPLWELAPFKDATDNTPPVVRLEGVPPVQGPRPVTASLTATVAAPLALPVSVSDDASVIPGERQPKTPPVTLAWSKFRGPGSVTFDKARPTVEKVENAAPGAAAFNGKATTMATFSEPGEYMLYLVANDWSGPGGRGFQCCWTNALVKVSVK